MAQQIQLRRGTTAQHAGFTGAVGEVTVDTDKDTIVVHDGATAGGIPLAKESAIPSAVEVTVHAASSKATPVDADETLLVDSAASNGLKKLTWANIKATLGATFAALAGSVSQAFSAASIELGHASDTTLSRSAAGVLAVENVVIPSISSTNTLTNKRVTLRVGSTTSSATPTINTDNYDVYQLTAQAADITSFTTNLSGTPTDGDGLIIEITGTAARAITWGASFEASTVALPTTTVSTDKLTVGFIWNSATSKWRCIASV